jgi:hypothetical protein
MGNVIYLRLAKLKNDIASLPVPDDYKQAMLCSVETYADQILARPLILTDDDWDDLEAIQQVTLGDMGELWFKGLQESSENSN